MSQITLKYVVDLAIEAEEKGNQFYKELAEKFSDNPIVYDTFLMLANDENDHVSQFRELLIMAEDIDFEPLENEIAFLNCLDVTKYFPTLKDKENLSIDDIVPMAFNFEKDSVLYYIGIRDIIGRNPVLDEIINIEKSHMMKLMKLMVTKSHFSGMADNWT